MLPGLSAAVHTAVVSSMSDVLPAVQFRLALDLLHKVDTMYPFRSAMQIGCASDLTCELIAEGSSQQSSGDAELLECPGVSKGPH